ncbi:hypothetical protein [Paenibacillus tyrfis]|uniref:hypothetical protein n=1 Tax=Paenibacillus tyrfis TaxID=1501230 RepID=UPI00209F1744|nr:hypothetical protein [Paenibacillus tyrfis]MCP1310077.1 hypothetical protein [Paenibacillus tyrfis]
MKPVNIPAFFHEVFGKRSTVLELALTLGFGVGMSAALLALTYSEWSGLVLWQLLAILLLALDIHGGVIANFTLSTNNHYQAHPVARLVFIAIHVQPILLAAVLGEHFIPCLFVWGYTIVSAFIVNALLGHPAQRTIAAVFVCTGFAGLLLFFASIPKLLLVMLFFFIFKVVFSFAVDHYARRER